MESHAEIDVFTVEETAVTDSLDVEIREFLVLNFPHWSSVFEKHRRWHRLSPLFTVLATRATPQPALSPLHPKREQLGILAPSVSEGFDQLNPALTLGADTRKLIGHTAIVIRSMTTTWNFRYEVASFQGVLVAPEYRRHGLAKKILRRSLDECRGRGFRFAILFCQEPLVEYYQRQNWRLADDSMVMWNNRDLPIAMRSNCPMYYELTDEPFPEGPIDVHSF